MNGRVLVWIEVLVVLGFENEVRRRKLDGLNVTDSIEECAGSEQSTCRHSEGKGFN